MSLEVVKRATRAALAREISIAARLGSYENDVSIHTRRPVPEGAGYPMIVIAADVVGDNDFLSSQKPIVRADLCVYGQQPDDYRTTEDVGYDLREMFHRNRWAIDMGGSGFRVVQITTLGPIEAPTDDETTVGRVVSLTIQLEKEKS